MLKSTVLVSLILCLACKSTQAQTGLVKIDTLLIGTWKGTSICQVKNSPCHDENVVYHISKNKGVDTFLSTEVKSSMAWKRKWVFCRSFTIKKQTNSPQLYMEFGLFI
jgi:hypothetical protein